MKRWSGIFRTLPWGIIQPYSGTFRTLCNACICRNLTYSKSWNIQNLSIIASQCVFRTLSYLQIYKNLQIFRSLTYLKLETYLEPSERFKMEFFAKTVLNYNCHSKVLHLRSLTGSWKHISPNKYSLTCRVTSCCGLCNTYLEPCLLL